MAQVKQLEPATPKTFVEVMKRHPNHMPKWPAYVLAAGAAVCALPAITMSPPIGESYSARGQEPGWNVTIGGGEIRYVGDYGETRIILPRSEPVSTFNGRRYTTDRLVVDVAYVRCNDSMSGHGYEHKVMVVADGSTFRGCGGERRTAWDV